MASDHAEAAAEAAQRIESACYHENQPGLVIPATEQGQVAADFRTLKQYLQKQLNQTEDSPSGDADG